MFEQQVFSEDEFVLDDPAREDQQQDLPDICEVGLLEYNMNYQSIAFPFPMPSGWKRKSKKVKKSKKAKKSKKKSKKRSAPKTRRKKIKRSKKDRSAKDKKKKRKEVGFDLPKTKIPFRLGEKMRSMALTEFEDEQCSIEERKQIFEKPSTSGFKAKPSTSLIDEILLNQARMISGKLPDKKPKSSSPINKGMTSSNTAAADNLIQWQNIESEAAVFNLKPIPLPNVHSIPPPTPSMPSQNFLLPPPTSSSAAAALFAVGGMPHLLKGPPGQQQLLSPPPMPLNMFNTAHQHLPSGAANNLALLQAQQRHQQQPNFFPNILGMFGSPPKQQQQQLSIGLSNALLDRISSAVQQQQQPQQQPASSSAMPYEPPTPVPPPPASNGGDPSFLSTIPPPPPPPYQSTSRCGLDSPMDIEDEDQRAADHHPNKNGNNNNNQPKKKRSRNVQIADELMKKYLKPYFIRRKITKDEYKDIMKKGVAKLSKLESLQPEKVEKFVEKYVQAVRKMKESRRPLGGH